MTVDHVQIHVEDDPLIPRLMSQVIPKGEQAGFLNIPHPGLDGQTPRELAESGCLACRGKVVDLLYGMGAKP